MAWPRRCRRFVSRLRRRIQRERARGRAYQPRFHPAQTLASWASALVAIASLALISGWSHYPLVTAPFGASAVLLFGHPTSPLAQPRNIVAGNTLAALVSVACVAALGKTPWAMGLAVGVTIGLGQRLRCLHPPSGAVALLGVLLGANPSFVLTPILTGSLLLVAMASLFSRQGPWPTAYPQHWL
ncbi:HPP family protein [Vulcanococcus limneticus]|uniref:HPP family protein n=1 Tax=Vulcanococcus limneticus TaxID=2170428 RepID=UPI00398C0935